MFKRAAKQKLLPIGARVFYYDSSLGRKVKGTLLSYNLIIACEPFNNKRNGQGCSTKGYFQRCERGDAGSICINQPGKPYIVRFDPTPNQAGYLQYPEGYLSAFGHDDIMPVNPAENIFPNQNIAIMARQWPDSVLGHGEVKSWLPWRPMTLEEYKQNKKDPSFEFCIRQVPLEDMIPMVSLWRTYSTNDRTPEGYWPPLMAAVNFHLRDGSFHTGVTGLVKTENQDGRERNISPVFIADEETSMRIYTVQQVQEWCLVL